MSVIVILVLFETVRFLVKDKSEKHFRYVCYLNNSTTKLKIIPETNNTPRGDCACIIEENAFGKLTKGEIVVTRLPAPDLGDIKE